MGDLPSKPSSNERSENTKRPSTMSPLKLTTIVVTLCGPAFYFQGRAFREGYLNYFKLEPSQFPSNFEDYYWYAYIAWQDIVLSAFKIPTILKENVWLILFILIYIILFSAAVSYLETRRSKKTKKDKEKEPKPTTFFYEFKSYISMIIFAPLAAAASAFLIALFVALLVNIFFSIGKYHAERDLELKRFLIATEIDGAKGMNYIIECTEVQCAVLHDGKMSVIRHPKEISFEPTSDTSIN